MRSQGLPPGAEPRLGRVLVTRTLRRQGRRDRLVIVRIGFPRRAGSDFVCPFQVRGVGRGRVKLAWGVDPMQALHLAFRGLGAELERQADVLGWGTDPAWIDFREQIPYWGDLRFTMRIRRIIEREVEREGRRLEARARRRGWRPPGGGAP